MGNQPKTKTSETINIHLFSLWTSINAPKLKTQKWRGYIWPSHDAMMLQQFLTVPDWQKNFVMQVKFESVAQIWIAGDANSLPLTSPLPPPPAGTDETVWSGQDIAENSLVSYHPLLYKLFGSMEREIWCHILMSLVWCMFALDCCKLIPWPWPWR